MTAHSSTPESEAASKLASEIRTVLSRLKRRLSEHGGRGELTNSQVSVLLRLEKEGAATVSALARAEGIRPQSMSSIVQALQQGGLVVSSSDPNDGRKTLLSLSPKCEKALREGRAARQDWLTTVLRERLTIQEQRQIATTLKLLQRLL